jgi:hypothetical protein
MDREAFGSFKSAGSSFALYFMHVPFGTSRHSHQSSTSCFVSTAWPFKALAKCRTTSSRKLPIFAVTAWQRYGSWICRFIGKASTPSMPETFTSAVRFASS